MSNWGTALATALPNAIRSVAELQNIALQREQFESEKGLLPLKMRAYESQIGASETEGQKNKYELRKLQEEEEWGKSPFNITLTRQFMTAPQEVQNDMLEWGQSMGYWDEKGMGMKKHGIKAISEVENNPQLLYRFGYPIILAKENELRTLMQQQIEMQNQGVDMKTDKKAVQLQNLINNKTKQYQQGLNIYQGQMNKLLGTTDKSLSDIELFMKDPEKFKEFTEIKNKGQATYSNLESQIFTKWLEGDKLSPQEQKIINRKFKEGMPAEETYQKARMRWKAKIDAFKDAINREPTDAEKRQLFVNDPLGILSPEEPQAQAIMPPASQNRDGIIKDTVTGKRYKSNGTEWVEIKK